MLKPKLVTLAASLVVLSLTAIGTLAWAFAEPPWQALPDGSEARLEGVTFGKTHEVLPGPNWRKQAYVWFRKLLASRSGWTPTTFTTPDDRLVFWVLRQNKPSDASREERVTVADEHGCESQAVAECLQTLPEPFPSQRVLCAYEARAFPRRGSRLALRFYQRRGDQPWSQIGEVPAGNPVPGPHPHWTPEPLPQSRRQGNLAFSLNRLVTGVFPGPTLRAAGVGEEVCTAARFQVTRDGRPQRSWQPVRVRVSDAAGNDWQSFCYDPDPVGNEQEILLGEPLWADERAWRLKVDFQRTAGFAPEELWQVRNIKVPAEAHRNTFPGEATSRFGHRIEFRRLAGAYASDTQDHTGVSFADPSVHVRVQGADEGLRVLLANVRGPGGRSIRFSRTYADEDGRFSWALADARPGSRVDLTFAIQKVRTVEFIAAPERKQ